MLFSHRIGPYHVHKEIAGDPQLLLRNRRGGFFLWQDKPTSKYHGLWARIDGVLYKSIASIKPGIDLPARKITNHFWGFSVDRGNDFHELFYMDPESDSLMYEMKNPTWFSLLLDVKMQFDQDEQGRFYELSEQDGCLVISYSKKTNNGQEYGLHLAISGYTELALKKEWVRQSYAWDIKRQDPPFERSVYKALSMKGSVIAFSVCRTKEEAMQKAKSVSARAGLIKEALERETDSFAAQNDQRIQDAEITVAHLASRLGVRKMIVKHQDGGIEGVYAGIPWFTQFWLRDFVLSASQLTHTESKIIFMRYLDEFEKQGNIGACDNQCAFGADSELLFFACASLLHARKVFTSEEQARVTKTIEHYLNNILTEKIRDGLVVNGPKETWMDTQYQDDGRVGSRIEIQALTMKAYHFAWQLTGNPVYRQREYELTRKVRLQFWNGVTIGDGLGDDTIRPNVFLAHLFYPELLLTHEWETVFSNTLSVLWLVWGGIATLPKKHPSYCAIDRSGADPNQSYHHGNAWFFINNIAALALVRVHAQKFKSYIDALLRSSTEDILWNGILGNHSEVSSAAYYDPRGCLAQTWSAATYADALEGIIKLKNRSKES